jgi:hypothetical protein
MTKEDKKASFTFPKIPSWFWDGTESVFWNILGNLIPIWFVAAISIYENGFNKMKVYDAIHQPYTYLILSATYLTTTFYILNRKGGFYKHKYFAFIFITLLMIIGYTIKDRKSLEDCSASFDKEIFIVIVFLLSFFSYIFYEFKSHFDIEKTSSETESKKQFSELKDSFNNFKDDE